MMARPSVRALTEWRALLGTIPTNTGSSNLLYAINGQFEFTFDDLVDFLLRVEMFMNGRTAFEVVVGKCHAGRMKIASVPARQTLNDFEGAGINKWQRDTPSVEIVAPARPDPSNRPMNGKRESRLPSDENARAPWDSGG